MLEGEGHYALTAIKDIKVTEEFLGLGREITRCQTRESRADCVSRRYEEQVLTSCHCAPLYIRSQFPQEVYINKTESIPLTGKKTWFLDRDLLQQTVGLCQQFSGGHRGLSGTV